MRIVFVLRDVFAEYNGTKIDQRKQAKTAAKGGNVYNRDPGFAAEHHTVSTHKTKREWEGKHCRNYFFLFRFVFKLLEGNKNFRIVKF